MINYENPDLILNSAEINPGKVTWKSPSNIALIKYWGKYGTQLPRNPSISFTLDTAATTTSIEYSIAETDDPTSVSLDFFFEGEKNEAFAKKVKTFLESLLPIFPFLGQLHLKIDSSNSFPHSAGIASSASAMSALTMCLCSMEDELFGTLSDEIGFLRKASYISRLGSGSACRSVYPVMAQWGTFDGYSESSNLFAIPCEDKIHPVFKTFRDSILIISAEEKSVSSRAGHALMDGNPFASARYEQANVRMERLADALKSGDLKTFGEITENEALTLHALMMTSTPSYLLMAPNSLIAINTLRRFRNDTGIPIYFTLDAGPNLHLLYPDEYGRQVDEFIRSVLMPLCDQGRWISDVVGKGPMRIQG